MSAKNIAITLLIYLLLYVALLISYISVIFHLAKKAIYKNDLAEQPPQGVQHV